MKEKLFLPIWFSLSLFALAVLLFVLFYTYGGFTSLMWAVAIPLGLIVFLNVEVNYLDNEVVGKIMWFTVFNIKYSEIKSVNFERVNFFRQFWGFGYRLGFNGARALCTHFSAEALIIEMKNSKIKFYIQVVNKQQIETHIASKVKIF